jgi:2'-5' RNA ligase superfamily
MPHSVLVVPVPEAEELVRHAHVTLLSPFAAKEELTDGLLGELELFFADCLPWSFRLGEVARFPGGTTYLSPEPVAPFRSLTHELHRHFPEYPPYGGQFDDVVPHLSVPHGFRLEKPITAYATRALLWWWDDGFSDVLATFPFGTTAA